MVTFKNKEVATNGKLPKTGEKAPSFTLVDETLKEVHLEDFQGKKKLLTVNPSFDTSVCSSTAKKFSEIAKKHPQVCFLAISKDLPFAQARFCKETDIKNLTFLSMMQNNSFAEDYGLLLTSGPLKGLCARAVILIDENDIVQYVQLVEEITQEPDYGPLEQYF